MSIAWLLAGDASYSERLWEELSSAARYKDWNPGHFLDTATLVQAVAIGIDTFRGTWPESRIVELETALIQKGVNPARLAYQRPDGWTTETGNWNVVANSSIGLGALALRESHPAESQEMLELALASLTSGLQGFAPSGGYQEGPQYWTYAIQHLTSFGLALRGITGSDHGIFTSPGMSTTAAMASHAVSPIGTPYNYSDSTLVEYGGPALFVLGKEYDDPVATKLAVDALSTAAINQYSLIWYDPSEPTASPLSAQMSLDHTFAGAGVATMRSAWGQSTATYVAMKSASSIGNGHPELDAGSFVLGALGVDWAVELGPDTYSLPGYEDGGISGTRWTYYRKRAEGNNTLAINPSAGPDQVPGVSTPIQLDSNGMDEAFAVADLSIAQSEASTWKRGVMLLDGRRNVRLQDEVTLPGPSELIWSMHTRAGIAVSPDGRTATLTQDGKLLRAFIASPSSARFTWTNASPLWSSPAPSEQASNTGTRKLCIQFTSDGSTTLVVDFMPVREGLPVSTSTPITPISGWSTNGSAPAMLDKIFVGGQLLSSFAKNVVSYDVPIQDGAMPPVVSASGTGTTVQVTQAQSIPGQAVIQASAPGKRTIEYRINFSRGPLAIANATSSTTWAAAQATRDGDPITKWVGGGNQSLQYDFRDPATIRAVRIKWAATGPSATKFGIVFKDLSGRWVTRYSGSLPADTAWQTYTVPATNARYFGIVIDNQGVSTRYTGIHEVEFLGAEPPASPSNALPAIALQSPPAQLRVGDSGSLRVSDATATLAAKPGYSLKYLTSDPEVLSVDPTGQYQARTAGATRIGAVLSTPDGAVAWAGAQLEVSNPWVSTLTASVDTFVNNATGSSTVNYGASQGLFVKRHLTYTTLNREAYVGFDLTRFAGAQISSATLQFSANVTDSSGSAVTLDLREILTEWGELTVTYASKPSLGPQLGSARVTSELAQYSIDVTDYVKSQLNQPQMVDFAFDQVSPTDGAGLLVIVYGKDTPHPPVLQIVTAYQP